MSNLTIDPNDVRAVKRADEHQHTAPAGEAILAGQYIRFSTAGKFELGNATTVTEIGDGFIAEKSVAIGEAVTGLKKPCVLDLGNALSGLAYGDSVFLSATDGTLADADPIKDEKQTVTIGGSPTGGTFTLSFKGQTTAGIAYDAAAAAVQSALEALSTIGSGNVSVSGSAGGPYTVEFIGALADQDVPAMTISVAGLTGGTPTGTIATSQPGVSSLVVGKVVPGWAGTAKKLLRITL